MDEHELMMKKCLNLASRGQGKVSPNPLVGCVIINESKIIGKGYHKYFGGHHAEVNAINIAKKNGFRLKNASLYVNLEPCSHFGKTPPCADLIIKEGIKKVFIGIPDPNPLVSGIGIRKLKKAGVEVVTDILKGDCLHFNRFFIKSITKHIPYVTLKVAQSIDGMIALNDFSSKWITGNKSRVLVHQLRASYDAVLIGKNTAEFDNPSLTVRSAVGRNPKRIVIDRDLSLSSDLKIFKDSCKSLTYIVTSSSARPIKGINYIKIPSRNGKIPLRQLLKALYSSGINSVLVEGGACVFSSFVDDNLFDDAIVMVSPKIIGNGISVFRDFKIHSLSKAKKLNLINISRKDDDVILYYKNN
jgi:diaminohydroxyphosphoribosylaminopyrimidine deaminase/5-amino-6-(5-phosphoribosylamino)uracil reductase